jgi:hypothetical protein
MRLLHFAVVLLFAAPLFAQSNSDFFVPNTTLAAQNGNNTSAASSFQSQSNGNLGAGNISKLNVHSLLYSGATTKVFAHLLLWFGQPGHVNVGYNSNNATQVQKQIADMISRGVDGVVIDWYGPNNSIDQATQLVMQEAEQNPGFTFAIMIDAGAMEQSTCSNCSAQQVLTQLLQYLAQQYFTSSAYFTINNQPVVTSFGIDANYSINWQALNSAAPVQPRFFFQDAEGFAQPLSDGSYSWVQPLTSDYGMSYLSNFYTTGLEYPNLETVGAAYKGFNDSLAAWGTGRVMGQQCGQTWLETFSEANSIYNSGQQLPYLQLVTWNDYDEATEIESGIDNCFSLSAGISGGTLQWGINGNENTVDHYNVYLSQDGQNLMALTATEPGLHTVDLCSFPIPAGNYQVFVQAVGKPSLANNMTQPMTYTPACSSAAASNSGLTASPGMVTVEGSQPGQVTVTAAQSGAINGQVSLSCGFLPPNLTCSFSPSTIDIGSGTATSSLTITNASGGASAALRRHGGPLYASWFFSFGMTGMFLFGNLKKRRRILIVLAVCALAFGMMVASSCGGGGHAMSSATSQASSGTPAANNYTIAVVANSGSGQVTTEVSVALPQGN